MLNPTTLGILLMNVILGILLFMGVIVLIRIIAQSLGKDRIVTIMDGISAIWVVAAFCLGVVVLLIACIFVFPFQGPPEYPFRLDF